ncbi:D-alanyl-D-alanine carboxypeptidase/D-alanyl-D-alanine endopeptidase [Hyalangium rubrum]|uniref:D-alanyl-D-alanine carboxypeptidase/D-alanyl-D-alanine-endopeptidase n=1 Tax=Hyalangium rubrum TaxID=3103134 RepID=A0ABU5H0F3_9BACT|nr:D-alanyl-D-alanine carboxypeptidase/D-alanyl-D-alanine-endopeptidase [Hyalangium sp. s54d21]MDY7226909.1 D-alanyl-D-alanine carboxypeptidase/D-alanyl-D-alanine-endopeptidase [Hyalangium sp. s54d21]
MQVHRARALLAATAIFVVSLASAAHAAPADKRAEREALKTALLEVLQRSSLKAARVGIHMQSLDDGQVVFAQNADELLNPASNMKLVTAAAALGMLGPEYRFDTEFLVDPELPVDGKVKTLYVRGKGDPSITTERLYGITAELFHTGLREVQDIIIDDSWFDTERTPPGYDQEESDRAYMAPTGAVSLNWNATAIYLRPGELPGSKGVVEMEPASDFFVIENQLSTGSRRARRVSVTSKPAGDKQRIIVRGQLPPEQGALSVYKKIDNPPMYFGFTLKEMLKSRGIKVKGRVKLGLSPSRAKILYVSQSDTFDIILKRLNKLSNNFVAETLLKAMGAEVKGAPGSFQKGIEVVEQFLERDVGIPRGTYVMKNGSGLNDTNRFSAAQLSRILYRMHANFPLAPEFLSSLGIAGKDGTLKYRFEGSEAVGRLRAKTGTLENVSALSGYVQAAGGEKFIFSMMVNDYPGRSGPVVQGLDALGAAVAATGSTIGPSRAVAALSDSVKPGGELGEVASRIKTYLALGKQRDQRNISFLRTAWRSERDPAVRAVLADGLYQSNPNDYLGARTLLDSYAATGDVYGRLRTVARELAVEVPGVGSMVELAAGGNAEALARVVELAGASRGDMQAEGELAVALGEVARTAPEELVMALREAGVPERDTAVTLLARGLVQAEDAEHPFWKSLRKQLGAADPAQATFVRNLDAALSQKVAEHKAPRALDATQMVVPGVLTPTSPVTPQTAETRPGG